MGYRDRDLADRTGDAGQAIQLQVVATNFLETGGPWQVPTFAFANATLTNTVAYTVPAAPSGLTATAVSTSQINLSWTNNADTNETGFQIDQATSADFTQGLTTVTVGANATTYSATGLSAGTTYYYQVRAINPVYSSANSTSTAAMTAFVGAPVAVAVPDGNFASDATTYYMNPGSGVTLTSPTTFPLSGWAISANPSTANGGLYESGGLAPIAGVDSVSSSGVSPWPNSASELGNQPASSYNAFIYFPGEQYNYGSVVGGAQPGASLTMTTTGINLAAVTGGTYTATIEYANVNGGGQNENPSATVALNILANGVVVGTGTLSGLAQGSPWTPVTVSWVAQAANAGQSIQLQVVATNFLEGQEGSGDQWQVPTFGFTDATLTAVAPPAAPSGLTATAVSASQIDLSWTNIAGNQTGFQIDQSTSADFTQGLTTVTVAPARPPTPPRACPPAPRTTIAYAPSTRPAIQPTHPRRCRDRLPWHTACRCRARWQFCLGYT